MGVDVSLVRVAAVSALGILILRGLPLAFRALYNETTGALFPTLSGAKRFVAVVFGVASLFWLLIVVGMIYAPITEFAPQLLPFETGLLRLILVFEAGLLVLLPLVMGVTEAVFADGPLARRISLLPWAFVHIIGLALALITLIPWIAWRFVDLLGLTKWKVEQFRIEIEPERYDPVADQLQAALRDAGLTAYSRPLPRLVETARWFLHRLGPPMLHPRADYHARRIVGSGYRLLVFDTLIHATSEGTMRRPVRAALIGAMPPDGLWLTQTKPARELEMLIRTNGIELSDIPKRLSELDVSLEEWRVLSWEYALVLANGDRRPREARQAGDEG